MPAALRPAPRRTLLPLACTFRSKQNTEKLSSDRHLRRLHPYLPSNLRGTETNRFAAEPGCYSDSTTSAPRSLGLQDGAANLGNPFPTDTSSAFRQFRTERTACHAAGGLFFFFFEPGTNTTSAPQHRMLAFPAFRQSPNLENTTHTALHQMKTLKRFVYVQHLLHSPIDGHIPKLCIIHTKLLLWHKHTAYAQEKCRITNSPPVDQRPTSIAFDPPRNRGIVTRAQALTIEPIAVSTPTSSSPLVASRATRLFTRIVDRY